MGAENLDSPVLSIDPREGTVSGPGGEVRLEPKVMEVLIVLARYAGHVVNRKDLLEAVWPGVVVTESTLSRCIYQLREQLRIVASESLAGSNNQNLIETLPKRGYRLLVEVDRTPSELRISGSSLLIELQRRHLLFIGIALFVLFAAAFFVFVE